MANLFCPFCCAAAPAHTGQSELCCNVCPCVYHELLKLPTADNPSSSTPLSGGIRIFVVNTDKAPRKVLDFQP